MRIAPGLKSSSIPYLAAIPLLAVMGIAIVGCSEPVPPARLADLLVCDTDRFDLQVTRPDGPALIVTDPKALASLPLDTVLRRIATLAGTGEEPGLIVTRLFDTASDTQGALYPGQPHCDSPDNPAHANGAAAECPRPESALAGKTGFFTPGDPDFLYPVAVVNRIDLAAVSGTSCGEYRIVYAKASGLTDPEDRVFLIFEAAVSGSGSNAFGCQDIADFWKSFETMTPEEIASRLATFFFEGIGGRVPALWPAQLGLGAQLSSYYNPEPTGQIRLSMHSGSTWELRQGQLGRSAEYGLGFEQTVAGNNLLPELFEANGDSPAQQAFLGRVWTGMFDGLGGPHPLAMTANMDSSLLSGESALGGAGLNDYVARAAGNDALRETLAERIQSADLAVDCPAGTTLTPDAMIRRATVESCAGCHAPSQLLGPDRDLGCGVIWPDSLGEVHIDERGNLSPAMKDLFLPHRAQIMDALLQACSPEDLEDLGELDEEAGAGAQTKSLRRRTIGGSVTH